MRHRLSGEHLIAAPADLVWTHLLDPRTLEATLPGAESVVALDASRYRLVTAIGIAFLRLHFTFELELEEADPPRSARLRAQGHAPGSEIAVTTAFVLEPLGPGRTRARWTAESNVRGLLAGAGEHLVGWAARSFSTDFWRSFLEVVERAAASGE